MQDEDSRRDFLKLIGLGGVVFASGLAGCAQAARSPGAPGVTARRDFFFLQLSDTHWGFQGPQNPEAHLTLPRTVATINSLAQKPDFVVFTGDLTHTTEDPKERRRRLAEFKEIASGLRVPSVRYLPGEHDTAHDRGEAYREHFGATRWSFEHEGVHFVGLDNVSDPDAALGDEQIAWLRADLARLPREAPIVVFAHRPLFELHAAWDWTTRDGDAALAVLSEHDNVTVFYGHIHQAHHRTIGRIAHHAARSLIFPLPAPGAAPRKAPLPWDAASPTHGIGYRRVDPEGATVYRVTELEPAPIGVTPPGGSATP